MLVDISIAEEYSDGIEAELREYFTTLSLEPVFNESIWFFDKLKRSEGHVNSTYKIYFTSIPDKYADIVRFWVLLRLRNGGAVQTQSSLITSLANFLNFLINEVGAPELFEVNRLVIEAYEDYVLNRRDVAKSSKESHWTAMANFFRDMQSWPQMPLRMPVPPGNPFVRKELDRKHGLRLVPDAVLIQLDAAYLDERVPLEDRLCYWILRSIPSRVSEVCSIQLDCLRPYEFNGRKGFIFSMPEWKQAANQHRSRKKLVHIIDEGHGKFLLDLVREQQLCIKNIQGKLPKACRGYLMVSPQFRYISVTLNGKEKNRMEPFVLTGPIVLKRMKQLSTHFNVVGPEGQPYDAITHCFRHNAITERLYEGFTYVEIRDTSGHHGNQMLTTSYVHVKDKEIKARAKERRDKGEPGPPILFQGRIINLSAEKEAQLLRNLRAYRIGDLGICSDVTSCRNDLFECLDCEYLVPDAGNEDYYGFYPVSTDGLKTSETPYHVWQSFSSYVGYGIVQCS